MTQPVISGEPSQVVESASASTACQTNASKFAYGLAAAVLCAVAAFVISIALLFVEVVTAAYDYDVSARYYTWEEDRFGQNGWDDELYDGLDGPGAGLDGTLGGADGWFAG